MKKLWLLLLMSLSLWAGVGNVMALKGQADIKRSALLVPVKVGMAIEEGDTILTHKASRIQVMLNDDTVLTIGPMASFEINKYLYDGSQKSQLQMRANRGFFRSVTGKIGKIAPERFKVKTASATIGIRGTDFSGDIQTDRSDFQCYSGTITVTFKGVLHEIDAGMMIRIDRGRVEIRKIDSKGGSAKLPRSQQHRSAMKKIIDKGMIRLDLPTDTVADITTQNNVPKEKPVIEEPFDIEPKVENRPQQY